MGLVGGRCRARLVVLACMGERITGDVGDVVVGECVPHLAADTATSHNSCCPEHLEVLRHGRLRQPEKVDEFVNTSFVFAQCDRNPEPRRVSERPQHLGGVGEALRGVPCRIHAHNDTSRHAHMTMNHGCSENQGCTDRHDGRRPVHRRAPGHS
jgi:hypothetical protein